MAKSKTVSRDRLAEALSIHNRTLARAYSGAVDCFYSREDQKYDLNKIAHALGADPKFLLDCLHSRDKALKRKDVAKVIGAANVSSLILRPALRHGLKTIRYSANDLQASTKVRRRNASGMFLEGSAA